MCICHNSLLLQKYLQQLTMETKEIKALVSLLDDDDYEVSTHVENTIKSLGYFAIPYLEQHWEEQSFNPVLQKKIEDLIHELQYSDFLKRLIDWKMSESQDLLEGLWIIASYQYPDLQIEKLRQEINLIYFDIWLQLKDELHPSDTVKILNSVFFDKYGFSANTKNFHSPSNSMINQVIESKKGNPISLCSVYLILAHKLNIPIFGVNLPSLFILTYKSESVQFYINVFNRGLVFTKTDIDTYLKQMNIEPQDTFYEPCSNFDIIYRTLLNLSFSFKKNADTEKSTEINQVLDLLKDKNLEDLGDFEEDED